MCGEKLVIGAIIFLIVLYFLLFEETKEGYRSPIYLNRQKMECDWYPRSSGSLYGNSSHVLSGFPYYDKAY